MAYSRAMRLHRESVGLPETATGCVVALGNFDGLHRGHQAVLAEARQQAERLGAPLGLMCFEPHPRRLFTPDLPPLKLFSIAEKLRLLNAAGIDHVFMLRFTRAFSQLNAAEFIDQVLVRQMRIKHLVTGKGFRFGYKRQGGNEDLAAATAFGYTAVDSLLVEGEPCSSTRIRQSLRDGSPQKAAELLGRPYALVGRVLKGEQRGRDWGFPTANIAPPKLFTPAYGIYAVTLTRADGTILPGVANYGIRPMYPLTRPLLEVHCFDASPNLYGERVEVAFHHYLRPEAKFVSEQALIDQIRQDSHDARQYFAALAQEKTG